VLRVEPGSGAQAAGLEAARIASDGNLIPGDIIVAIDDQPTADVSALLTALDGYRIGDVVSVRLWRAGSELTVSVTLDGLDTTN